MQAFRFMVGPGHCPMISKYGPSLSKAVGPVDPIFLFVKISHLKKATYSKSINSTKQKVHVGCQYSKTCLKQPLKKGKIKILIKNGSLMKVEGIAECSPWSFLQYFWPALSDNWSSFLSGHLRQVLLYNQRQYTYICIKVSVSVCR